MESAGLAIMPVLILLTEVLEVPGRSLQHPLEEDGAQRPNIRAEGRPLPAYQHLGRLVGVEEDHVLGHRVLDEVVLEIPQTKVGDLGGFRVGHHQNITWLEVPVDHRTSQVVKVGEALGDPHGDLDPLLRAPQGGTQGRILHQSLQIGSVNKLSDLQQG